MLDLFQTLDCWKEQNEEIAIATLVGVRGSAPRLPGARLGLTRSGRMTGSVSGGCVENDVFERAQRILDGAAPQVVSYGLADESPVSVGLNCGSIDVLIDRHRADEIWKTLRADIEAYQPVALAVCTAPEAWIGRRMLVRPDSALGSIAPAADETVIVEARRLLSAGGTSNLRIESCGASVFVQAFVTRQQLYIVGATHIGIALARMARTLGFRVTVIDARSLYLSAERFPEADDIVRTVPAEALRDAQLGPLSSVVVLTHDFKFDVPALACALRSEAGYIGVMGSRATHAQRIELLRQEGCSDTDLARLRAPIGLDIGARTPEEIALSILAEILAVKNGRGAQPLREGKGTIHPRR